MPTPAAPPMAIPAIAPLESGVEEEEVEEEVEVEEDVEVVWVGFDVVEGVAPDVLVVEAAALPGGVRAAVSTLMGGVPLR